jgi:hypothetical protein
MDPYLERFWNDVHGTLVTYIKDALNESLPTRYRATMQERVVIADLDQPLTGTRYPDVAVVDWPEAAGTQGGGVATEVHSERLLIRAPELLMYDEPLRQYFIEITDSKFGEDVVTAIEVLSPENKRVGDGMSQFRRKQEEYRRAKVNRVEIDLLRGGRRLFEFPESILGPQRRKPYYVTVHRGEKTGEAELYAVDLRDTLPVIKVPLRPGEPDVGLALQPLIKRVYRNGRFPIDYGTACDPPLEKDEEAWARQIIAERTVKPPG